MRIYPQKGSAATRADLCQLGALLLKLGYTVRLNKFRHTAKGSFVQCLDFSGPDIKSAAPGDENTEDGGRK